MKEIIYLKGKESAVVGFLLILAVILFIVPIVVVLLFRTIFRMIVIAKEQARLPQSVITDLEKVY